MIKRVASTMLVLGVAHALALAEPSPTALPLLKVTYGEMWGPSPLMYSYSVWPSGEIRYEPLPLDYNGVKTRQAKTLRVSPETALRAVSDLIKVGFLALQPEVRDLQASKEGGKITLEHIFITDSQKTTVEFHFENEDYKITLDYIEILPWAKAALQRAEKRLGVTELVE